MAMQDIDCVILCGGLGTRLRRAVRDRPKPMALVNGRPFLDVLIDYCCLFGSRRFILCAGHRADVIETYYAKRPKTVDILVSREAAPLGTGGAIRNAEHVILSDRFLVLNGDSFCPVDLNAFYDFHLTHGGLASLVAIQSCCGEDKGTLSLTSSGMLAEFTEKTSAPGGAWVSAGIYLFERAILNRIPCGRATSLEYDLFPRLAGNHLYGYPAAGPLLDIGTPARLKKAQEELATTVPLAGGTATHGE